MKTIYSALLFTVYAGIVFTKVLQSLLLNVPIGATLLTDLSPHGHGVSRLDHLAAEARLAVAVERG